MTLDELVKNEESMILSIEGDEELKKRLASFGIKKNTIIKLKERAIGTIKIEALSSSFALRVDEAKKIKVKSK